MNRFELVKKLSSLAEIPTSEGEIFLELFLRKLSGIITTEQLINIPGLGSFSLHKNSSGQSAVTFFSDTESRELVFYLSEERNVLRYQPFNISLGKPVFPLKGKSESMNFILHPGENFHSLESKTDKLLSFADKTEVIEEGLSPESIVENNIQLTEDIFEEITDSTIEEISEVSFSESEEIISAEDNKESLSSEEIENAAVIDEELPSGEHELPADSLPDTDENPESVSLEDLFEHKFENETEKSVNPDEMMEPEIQDKIVDENDFIPPGEEHITVSFEDLLESEPPDQSASNDNESDLTKEIYPQSNIDLESADSWSSVETNEPVSRDQEEQDDDNYFAPSGDDTVSHIIDETTAESVKNASEIPGDENRNEADNISDVVPEPGDDLIIPEITETEESDLQEQNHDDTKIFSSGSQQDTEEVQEEEAEATLGDLAGKITQQENEFPGEVSKESPDQDKTTFDNKPKDKKKPEDEDFTADYQRVKSLTREFFNLSETEQNEKLSWDFGESEQLEKDIKKVTRAFDEETVGDKNDGFTSVKSRKSTYEWTPETYAEFEKIHLTEEEPEEIVLKKEDEIFTSGRPITKTIKITKSKKKKNKYFVIALSIVTFFAMAVIAYLNFFEGDTVTPIKSKVEPLIIERNDLIPVMAKTETAAVQIIDMPGSVSESGGSTGSLEGDFVKVTDNIYSKGMVFYAQVSSWQTRTKADREMEKYISRGYKAQIETSVLRSGLWYRILVGEFNTQSDAENYLKNNY